MKPLNFGVIGAGGYAKTHIEIINHLSKSNLSKLSAVVIRNPEKYKEIENDFKNNGIRIYRNYSEMFETEKGKLDVITIPSGIDTHEEQSVAALLAGFHVICEKPVSGTIAEAFKMKEAAVKYNKKVAIGYQHIFSPSIQKIKEITINQELGALKKVKGIALLIRTGSYFKRNLWAGKIFYNGKKIYDSPIQNMTGHFLNNMLYLAGENRHDSAEPVFVYGENYKANPIECSDTQFIKVGCKNGVEIFFYTSIASDRTVEPFIELFYEKGKIEWYANDNGSAKVYSKNKKQYEAIDEFDNGETPIKELVFSNTISSINNNREPLANIHNSLQHTICVEKSFDFFGEVQNIPAGFIEKIELADKNGGNDFYFAVKGLSGIVKTLYEKEIGFSEKLAK